MSREFGDNGYHEHGFFHHRVQQLVNTLENEAREDFHKEFIPLFQELYEIAFAISSVEAGDSGLYRSIIETINRLPRLKQVLAKLEDEVRPYQDVAEEAVRRMSDGD